MAEQVKIKVHYFNDPTRVRFVTKEAYSYIKEKWVVAKDQAGVEALTAAQKKTPQDAKPAEDAAEREKLIEKYKEITGKEPESGWVVGRIHIEIQKALKQREREQPQSEVIEVTTPDPEETPVETIPDPEKVETKEKAKRGPKKKETPAEA